MTSLEDSHGQGWIDLGNDPDYDADLELARQLQGSFFAKNILFIFDVNVWFQPRHRRGPKFSTRFPSASMILYHLLSKYHQNLFYIEKMVSKFEFCWFKR